MAEKTPTPHSFFRAGVILFVCSNAANVFQFLFQSLMRRELPAGEFSLMNSLFSSGAFLSLPIGIWTVLWTRKFAELRARNRLGLAIHYIRKLTVYSLGYAALVCAGLFVLLPQLKEFLNTGNTAALGAFIFGLAVTLSLPAAGILLQGMQAFGILAAVAFLGPALRLILGYFFLKLGWGVAGGVWATTLQGVAQLGFAVWFFYHFGLHRVRNEEKEPVQHWKLHDVWIPAASVAVATVLLNSDFVLVQHLFAPAAADRFATAAIFGHSMVFFLAPFAAVLLPKVVDHFEGWQEAESSVARKALGLSFGIAVLMAAGGTLLAGPVLKVFTGHHDPETLVLVRGFLWAMIPTALASLTLNALVGRLQGRLLLICLAASLLLPALILLGPMNPSNILIAHFITGAVLLAVMIIGNLGRLKSGRRRAGHVV